MRISDWSSDVCSSDLSSPNSSVATCCARGSCTPRGVGAGAGHRAARAVGRCTGMDHALVPDRRRDRFPVLARILLVLRIHADRTQARERDRPRRFDFALDRPDPGFLTSEEHTSELQSLMRITYAVFCLKK